MEKHQAMETTNAVRVAIAWFTHPETTQNCTKHVLLHSLEATTKRCNNQGNPLPFACLWVCSFILNHIALVKNLFADNLEANAKS
jgi:hypothetical protein